MSKQNQQPKEQNKESRIKNRTDEKETRAPEQEGFDASQSLNNEWQAKAEEYLNDLKRVQADFENYKKRQAAESKEFSTHLAKSLVSDLIPVLTNLQAASEHVPADAAGSPWVMGITYIEKQFEDALKNYGVTPIEVKPGDTFNPLEHEAVSVEDSGSKLEDGNQVITKVVQKGYRVGNKVIKPVRVTVQ